MGYGESETGATPWPARRWIAARPASAAIRSSGIMFGPSDGAVSGSGCVSMKNPATPTAAAARASTGRELALPARGAAQPAGLLHRMGGVENDRKARRRQLRQRAHVGDQRVVAERRAALRQQDLIIAGVGDLRDHVRHVPGREELALLDVDRLAGPGGGHQQVRLAAEEGRDLQHVADLGHRGALVGQVDVGQHRAAGGLFHRLQRRKPVLQAQAPFA